MFTRKRFGTVKGVEVTEYVYKLKNGKVISAYADEKGNISINKESLEIMVNSWNDIYEKGRADAIDELSDLIDRLLWRYDEETYKDLSESFKESARLLKGQKK